MKTKLVFFFLTFLSGLVFNSSPSQAQSERISQQQNPVIQVSQVNRDTFYRKGNSYYDSQNYQAALQNYNMALSIDPKYYPAYFERGRVYYQLGQYQKSITDFKKAIKGNYKKYWAFSHMGVVYADLGDYKKAISYFNKAIALDPNFATAYNNRGVAYERLGNTNKAISDYKKALKIKPNNQVYKDNLANLTQPARNNPNTIYNPNWSNNNNSNVQPYYGGTGSHTTDPTSSQAHENWEECGNWSGC